MRRGLCPLLLLTLAGCVRYEYEEEIYLETDGSGEIRVHGSREILAALGNVVDRASPDLVTREALVRTYERGGLRVLSVKRSRRDGRTFFHVRLRFSDLEALSRHPAFRGRSYALAHGEDGLTLRAEIKGEERFRDVPGVERGELAGFRIHFPSPVRFHNSPTGLARGNIVAWEQTIAQHLAGEPIRLEARFDQRTVFEATLIIVGAAILLVTTGVVLGLYFTLRVGRRQLAAGGHA